MRLSKSQLQRAINRASRYSELSTRASAVVVEHCVAVYGVEPGEVNCEEVIDSIYYAGAAITAEKLDESMRKAMRCYGIAMPDGSEP